MEAHMELCTVQCSKVHTVQNSTIQ